MNEIVYLNGEFLPLEEAKISPNDRGFHFADGVYEVTKYYNGRAFRYADHIWRLKRSLAELEINFTDFDRLAGIFDALLAKNGLQNKHAGVYLQISRGAYQRIHNFPTNISPTVYAFAYQMPSFSANLEKGIKVITHDDIRWQRCDIKSVSLLANSMLYEKAVKAGAGECVLIRDGEVTEATHSSVLGVENGVVVTRPLSNLILPGITRKVILEICQNCGIPVKERVFDEQALLGFDELIIAGTGSEVIPAVQVNGDPIGTGKPGEITRLIQSEFFKLV